MANYKIVGISDDQDTCECCGKTGLKRVVYLENLDTQCVMAYGTTCAAKTRKISTTYQKAEERSFERKMPKYVIRCSHLNLFIKDIYLEEDYTPNARESAKIFTSLPNVLGNCVHGWDEYHHDGQGNYLDSDEIIVFKAIKL